jgi:hypothetical protein
MTNLRMNERAWALADECARRADEWRVRVTTLESGARVIDAGEYAAHAIIAGTLVVLGRTGAHAGRASKRGSIVAVGAIDIPPTYRYACTYEPTYLRLLFNDLRRRHQLPLDDSVIAGRYRRYCGDAGEPGKGEILVRDTLYT